MYKTGTRAQTQMKEIDDMRNALRAKSSNLNLDEGETDYWREKDVVVSCIRRLPIITGVMVARFAEHHHELCKKALSAPPHWAANRSIAQYVFFGNPDRLSAQHANFFTFILTITNISISSTTPEITY